MQLQKLLLALGEQETAGRFTFSVVVVDNDADMSGRRAVSGAAGQIKYDIAYYVEPIRNIALARNMAILHSQGDFIAMIDDDECPERNWLLSLFNVCVDRRASGVLGPVLSCFEQQPPKWIEKAGFYRRPIHRSGEVMSWKKCRTGNVLFDRRIVTGLSIIFDADFGTGSEDVDFFRRMTEVGCQFIWCNEAVVHESVPPERCRRSFLLKRALLVGANSLKHPGGRALRVAKSVIAVPVYALLILLCLPFGHYTFMKYSVKLCRHLGRVLAVVDIHPVRTREM